MLLFFSFLFGAESAWSRIEIESSLRNIRLVTLTFILTFFNYFWINWQPSCNLFFVSAIHLFLHLQKLILSKRALCNSKRSIGQSLFLIDLIKRCIFHPADSLFILPHIIQYYFPYWTMISQLLIMTLGLNWRLPFMHWLILTAFTHLNVHLILPTIFNSLLRCYYRTSFLKSCLINVLSNWALTVFRKKCLCIISCNSF